MNRSCAATRNSGVHESEVAVMKSCSRLFALSLAAIGLLAPVALFAGEARPPASSRIVEIYGATVEEVARPAEKEEPPAPPLNRLATYRRPEIIGNIYQGKFDLVPATGLDNLRYYAQTVADLTAQCPALGLEAAKFQIFPYLLSGVADLMHRFQTGQLSQSEAVQAAWMAMLGLSQHASCQYDPALGSRAQAQARCDAAARAWADLGILPSPDATRDVSIFLGRYGCHSEQARHLARQLVRFGRTSHTRSHFFEPMPPPNSPAGRTLAAIFTNCTRRSIDERTADWCGCYVRTVYRLHPGRDILAALADNPFVDGSTYLSWMVAHVPGGEKLLKCERTLYGRPDWGASHAPRTTACLIDQAASPGAAAECRYRAAWGEFTLTRQQCPAQITSRRWGYREVDCAAGGAVATPAPGPRVWRSGVFTMIDYERELEPGFVPPLPADARDMLPLAVRLLKETRAGRLTSMSLTVLTDLHLLMLGMPMRLSSLSGAAIAALDQEGALILKCTYKSDAGERSRMFWFERVPELVAGGKLDPALQPYFSGMAGAASRCPARY